MHLVAGAAALPATSRMARAQDYPTRSVRIINPVAAGGPNDVLARLVGQLLSERLGQQFVIENRPGGGNNIGTEAVVRSPANGYTLLLVNTTNATNATLYEKLSFNFIRDISPIASIARAPNVLAVNPAVPANTVLEFIAYAKTNPGPISMASAGTGTPSHISGELFKMMAGITWVHVPYRGAVPALTDLIGGQVQVSFISTLGVIDYIRAGTLRPLAVTSATRLPGLPSIPTVGEFLPGYEASNWYGLCAPRNTPREIIDKLNKEVNAVLAEARVVARIIDLGGTPLVLSPADFAKVIAADTEKWAKVIRAANIKAE
jgi:tripartite-type tricarboxylate transporter receptor subunit TctC